MALLEVKNIHTYYGAIHALKGISIHVDEGEIVTLIGANGAGKTTTLNTICGICIHARDPSCWMASPSTSCPHMRSCLWACRSRQKVVVCSVGSPCWRTWRWAPT